MRRLYGLFLMILGIAAGVAAHAEEPDACRVVRIADGGWTDNTAQNGLASVVLEALGYEVDAKVLAMPVILKALENGDMDVWLDNWMPSQKTEVGPYLAKQTIVDLRTNLEGAGYGPVVPGYVADAGVKDLEDLAAAGDKFDRKFYGIEPGNDGNRIVQSKIDDPSTGLAGWKLIESSEQGMLTEVDKLIAAQQWVAFLAWTPHPVMGKMDLYYLSGFEADGFGEATVHTLTRATYEKDCPNAARFFRNLAFTLDLEGAVMQDILDGRDAEKAAAARLKADPAPLTAWLDGVSARDGGDGLAAVRKRLGL